MPLHWLEMVALPNGSARRPSFGPRSGCTLPLPNWPNCFNRWTPTRGTVRASANRCATSASLTTAEEEDGPSRNPVTGGAMHGRLENLTPTDRDVLRVATPQRFSAAEYVEERPEGPGKRRENHEGPLEDRRFWGGPPDIDGDEQKRRQREGPHKTIAPPSIRKALSTFLAGRISAMGPLWAPIVRHESGGTPTFRLGPRTESDTSLLVESVDATTQFGARTNVEFAVYPGEVDFHGLDADKQRSGDITVGHPRRRKLGDAPL
jgi:hypothetical protein